MYKGQYHDSVSTNSLNLLINAIFNLININGMNYWAPFSERIVSLRGSFIVTIASVSPQLDIQWYWRCFIKLI